MADLLSDPLPKTCDADFWEVLKNRAWEQGQREVTQNANLLAKPDSVLMYSCFDRFMGNLAGESKGNYPGDPNETFDESFLGLGGFAFEVLRDVYNLPLDVADDPYLKNTLGVWNLHMHAALEILILDTMVSDVSFLQPLTGNIDDIGLAIGVCKRKYYLEDSTFHHRSIGARGAIDLIPDNDVNSGFGCNNMARIWNEAKCYNANTETAHDGYFTFGQYTATDGNYRTHVNACTSSSGLLNNLGEDYMGIACDFYFHGFPALPIALYWPWSGTPPMSWSTANTAANPAPGAAGAVEPYNTMRNLYDPALCTTYAPIQTGVVVMRKDGTTYDDAYCIAPGCWYNADVSTTQCQPY